MDAKLQQTISMYRICFLICLALAIIFLIVSVILCIVFHIPNIIANRTGRAMRKSMKAIEEKNARTGQLRQNISVSSGRHRHRLAGDVIIRQPFFEAQLTEAPLPKNSVPLSGEMESVGTDALEQETDILTGGERFGTNTPTEGEPSLPIRFVLEKRVMLIHSDEIL